jgi:hypothetical protein
MPLNQVALISQAVTERFAAAAETLEEQAQVS